MIVTSCIVFDRFLVEKPNTFSQTTLQMQSVTHVRVRLTRLARIGRHQELLLIMILMPSIPCGKRRRKEREASILEYLFFAHFFLTATEINLF